MWTLPTVQCEHSSCWGEASYSSSFCSSTFISWYGGRGDSFQGTATPWALIAKLRGLLGITGRHNCSSLDTAFRRLYRPRWRSDGFLNDCGDKIRRGNPGRYIRLHQAAQVFTAHTFCPIFFHPCDPWSFFLSLSRFPRRLGRNPQDDVGWTATSLQAQLKYKPCRADNGRNTDFTPKGNRFILCKCRISALTIDRRVHCELCRWLVISPQRHTL